MRKTGQVEAYRGSLAPCRIQRQRRYFTLSYAQVDDAIDFIMHEGHGTLLAKIDIHDAYRLVPVHPEDRPLLGMAWRSHFFVDLAFPLGLHSTPFIFNQFAEGWHWILQHNLCTSAVLFLL